MILAIFTLLENFRTGGKAAVALHMLEDDSFSESSLHRSSLDRSESD